MVRLSFEKLPCIRVWRFTNRQKSAVWILHHPIIRIDVSCINHNATSFNPGLHVYSQMAIMRTHVYKTHQCAICSKSNLTLIIKIEVFQAIFFLFILNAKRIPDVDAKPPGVGLSFAISVNAPLVEFKMVGH